MKRLFIKLLLVLSVCTFISCTTDDSSTQQTNQELVTDWYNLFAKDKTFKDNETNFYDFTIEDNILIIRKSLSNAGWISIFGEYHYEIDGNINSGIIYLSPVDDDNLNLYGGISHIEYSQINNNIFISLAHNNGTITPLSIT